MTTSFHAVRHMRPTLAGAASVIAVAVVSAMSAMSVLLGGCVTTDVATTPRDLSGRDVDARDVAAQRRAEGKAENIFDEPIGQRIARTYKIQVLAEVQPRGTIPYDDLILPQVSPDGRFIATQTGLAVDWETLLAEPGASVPLTTRIEIYELGEGRTPPVLRATVDEAALLGRAVNDRGFLIESPRADGSRWIGLVEWQSGSVAWLVDEPGTVAAFATLGPDDRLAYSSRPVGGDQFDLVVRHGAESWEIAAPQGSSWLMPTWSRSLASDGDGLFALMLHGDMLDVVFLNASSANEARRTMRRQPLASSYATIDTAYQTLNAHTVTVGVKRPEDDRLPFFHPHRLRAAVWQPGAPPVILDRGSFDVVLDHTNEAFVLMVTKDDLIRRALADELAATKLIAGTHIPRATASRERPYILLQPVEGAMGVTVMRFLEKG